MSKIATTALLLAFVLLRPVPASGEAVRVPCDRPFVFPNAALNVVVMPYSQPASLPDRNSKVGEQLGALVELEALLAIAKFRSVGFIQIVGSPKENCTAEAVLDKLLGKVGGATAQLKPKHALLMIWGRIFESGSDLYVQSYVRFMRRDTVESVKVEVARRPLEGRLSAQSFACASRKISLRDLDEIQKQYATSSLLRVSPENEAAFVPIPETGGPYSFWITEMRGDWVQLEPMTSNERRLPRGWVRARAPQREWALRRVMPEMALIEGLAGYLSARVAADGAPFALDAAASALDAYLQRWRSGALTSATGERSNDTALAVAIPEQLRGFTALLRADNSDAALQAARGRFERSISLIPYSGDARNLAAIVRVALAFSQPQSDPAPRRFVDDLIEAVGTDPANPDILANLATVYDLLLDAAPPGWAIAEADRKAFQDQRQALRALLGRTSSGAASKQPY
jgi:hypothetical protein